MPNSLKHIKLNTRAARLALGLSFVALSFVAFSQNANALPTYPITSGDPDILYFETGHTLGASSGPSLTSGSSYWSWWGGWGGWSGWGSGWSGWSGWGGHDGSGSGDYNNWHDYDNKWCNNNGDEGDGSSAPVPEPTSALLMSLGLAGAAYLKRRRG